ncbi:MAG: 30S ribosomal protein S13 [Candidatus Ryanbacteria bacterium RIFCSPHIGHO2_12_FULL_47_12b]|uniref:Small ribosomal subunit protein uS13 n=1 Tax=Candidatus Ryanbacteria bacterium RIFCSPLOWO2_02_FULL_47_14 TaxID=1802129 RepID=A0A1G2H1D6_9BACT|nr:MAG: SSU ribosomal protein S13p (S18e) [Parcubacteria group bacterium GW2011_GWA2_47_10b]KKU85503.1 MAG: SSU ribosomal protein S13p (S18e) [Parcubacteria group bacterium GW2011_GWA1_47_9]OGZ44659.1 MAG: 30S ribosomal protein S13 [Candidatus Ryanbacteria bacterium RIFCSPHIGHO2_01_FULL_48_80]OGZ48170.1 MAG: 30S ribosomal protein S13 [Candidatus Ryanbacteria bacterium RIFCSPHIGHO2_02_FULL_47_25]OGZ51792.1 MAG: 30S ribosomal protein S13 [Candidatus Ryanbacteria bacterium RIFCSPLOWO2_01_FULL_47_7
MARIAGVNISDEKKIEIALSGIYGIGRARARRILAETKISDVKRTKDLSQEEMVRLRAIIEKEYTVEGALRREILLNIKRLKDIGSYRGYRHSRSLPVRGQRTKSNSRTRRGNVRKTMGSGRRKVEKK